MDQEMGKVCGHSPADKRATNICQNIPTICRISHPTKLKLRISLNLLKSKADELDSQRSGAQRNRSSSAE
ncbi:hypothetical protein DPMN_105210 [Dreissena polymorpha]|uniref:Uncharacterized protein n=1 Tax=Dreissena polymorpha TaxID=45954 RepID=A0A9D4K312_DREPO|nr:hypothetical protein DPMN_105210 [Dreissena polymorpha]